VKEVTVGNDSFKGLLSSSCFKGTFSSFAIGKACLCLLPSDVLKCYKCVL
jgi:hypothetical protein